MWDFGHKFEVVMKMTIKKANRHSTTNNLYLESLQKTNLKHLYLECLQIKWY